MHGRDENLNETVMNLVEELQVDGQIILQRIFTITTSIMNTTFIYTVFSRKCKCVSRVDPTRLEELPTLPPVKKQVTTGTNLRVLDKVN